MLTSIFDITGPNLVVFSRSGRAWYRFLVLSFLVFLLPSLSSYLSNCHIHLSLSYSFALILYHYYQFLIQNCCSVEKLNKHTQKRKKSIFENRENTVFSNSSYGSFHYLQHSIVFFIFSYFFVVFRTWDFFVNVDPFKTFFRMCFCCFFYPMT